MFVCDHNWSALKTGLGIRLLNSKSLSLAIQSTNHAINPTACSEDVSITKEIVDLV